LFKLSRVSGRDFPALLPVMDRDRGAQAAKMQRRSRELQAELAPHLGMVGKFGLTAESSQVSYTALQERNRLYIFAPDESQPLEAFFLGLEDSLVSLVGSVFPDKIRAQPPAWIKVHLQSLRLRDVPVMPGRGYRMHSFRSIRIQALPSDRLVAEFEYAPQDYGILGAVIPSPRLHFGYTNQPMVDLSADWKLGTFESAFFLSRIEVDLLEFFATIPGTELDRPER